MFNPTTFSIQRVCCHEFITKYFYSIYENGYTVKACTGKHFILAKATTAKEK